jgi:hypothetical protein
VLPESEQRLKKQLPVLFLLFLRKMAWLSGLIPPSINQSIEKDGWLSGLIPPSIRQSKIKVGLHQQCPLRLEACQQDLHRNFYV